MSESDPILTLHLPRSVVSMALAALAKLPLEQVAAAHNCLAQAAISADEYRAQMLAEKQLQERQAYMDRVAAHK
jgi:hypothetical protein